MAVVSLQSAASGLSALSTQLDVTANNLANVNTTGFKASRVNFESLLYQEKAVPGVENANGDQRPTGIYVGLGVKVGATQTDFSQGNGLITTDNPLDMAIEGLGFFQVAVEDDIGEGGIAYTRVGSFTLNSEGDIVLANSDGRRLVPNINVGAEAGVIDVSADGRVLFQAAGEAAPTEVGQIELANFVNPTGLKPIGAGLYVESVASGPPLTAEPKTDGFGSIQNGMLENSNVDPTEELIQLIRTQRAFEMNSQVIRAADDTLRAVGQLRR